MWLKIPCKKYQLSRLNSLALAMILSIVSVLAQAGQNHNEDRALFWSIHKDGHAAGFLLGTIHSEDPRVLEFSEDFLLKLKSNTIFAMEMVPVLPTLARLTDYMRYPPDKTLESVIGAERFKALQSALSVYKMPPKFLNRMKPWAAMMTLSTPPPETGFFMDLSLSLRASGNGLEVMGLETLEQQLSFLEDMPMPMQLALLDQAIAEFEEVDETHEQMVNAYLQNNLVELQKITDEQLSAVGDEAGDYFIESGIHARNRRMAESLLPQLEHNTVFVAVGALHLPGEEGLLSLLRRQGFELNPLGMPFTEQSQ